MKTIITSEDLKRIIAAGTKEMDFQWQYTQSARMLMDSFIAGMQNELDQIEYEQEKAEKEAWNS